MIAKALDKITAEDLNALTLPEGKSIDYKRSLPGASDAEKREFLCDVSSFANTNGGDLVYGIEEVDGIPVSVVGLASIEQDQTKQTLENLIRDGLEPRPPGVALRCVPLVDGSVVLIVRIQQSWIAPHRVTFRGHDKFYARNSAGRYPLDVVQLREAFLLGERIETKMRSFVFERYVALQEGRTPARLLSGATLALHILPVSAFTYTQSLDVSTIAPPILPTISTGSGTRDWRINLDGLLTIFANTAEGAQGYTQLFRNGAIESTFALDDCDSDGKASIPAVWIGNQIVAITKELLDFLRKRDLADRMFVFIRILCPRGARLELDSVRVRSDPVYEGSSIPLPDVLLDASGPPVQEAFFPTLTVFWNAFGMPDCWNYKDGTWVQR